MSAMQLPKTTPELTFRQLTQMREYFEAVKGVRPDDPLSPDVRRHAAEVLSDDLNVSLGLFKELFNKLRVTKRLDVSGLYADKLNYDYKTLFCKVLGAPATTLTAVGAALVSLAADAARDLDDDMSICYWWQVSADSQLVLNPKTREPCLERGPAQRPSRLA